MFARALLAILGIAVAGFAVHDVSAQAYPSKPVRIIVPYPAGGTSDILARTLGQKLSEMWSQPVLVENKPGANGNVVADFVAKAAPDGYTLLLSDVGALAISPSVFWIVAGPTRSRGNAARHRREIQCRFRARARLARNA